MSAVTADALRRTNFFQTMQDFESTCMAATTKNRNCKYLKFWKFCTEINAIRPRSHKLIRKSCHVSIQNSLLRYKFNGLSNSCHQFTFMKASCVAPIVKVFVPRHFGNRTVTVRSDQCQSQPSDSQPCGKLGDYFTCGHRGQTYEGLGC